MRIIQAMDEKYLHTDAEGDILEFISAEDGMRLDAFTAQSSGLSRSRIQKMTECGDITVNGTRAAKNAKLKKGDTVTVFVSESLDYDAEPENIPLDVCYEDGDIIVVNKPVGMVVHPAPGHATGTLVNALMYRCRDSLSGIGGVNRPGIVHRIDRDTSGLICIAKNDAAHLSLAAQLKEHTMHREYRMINVGGFREDCGTVDAPIGRHPVDRKKMAVILPDGGRTTRSRSAVTHWRVLERFGGFTYSEAVLETGRTHQIRVHMAYIGHPIMGDVTYGGGRTAFEKHNAPLIPGQMLHAGALVLVHPRTGVEMHFASPLPDNFEKILAKLRSEE